MATILTSLVVVGWFSYLTSDVVRPRTTDKQGFEGVQPPHTKPLYAILHYLYSWRIGAINSYHGYIKWCNCKHLFDVIGLNDLYKYAHENIKKSQPSL